MATEQTVKIIRRIEVLREYDIKESPSGKQMFFSIKFINKSGELVFLPRAIAVGLPWNVSGNRQRGVMPVDIKGEKIGHIYPVRIDNIIEWNSKRVTL